MYCDPQKFQGDLRTAIMLIYAALNRMLSNQYTYSLMFSNRLLSTCQTQLDPAQWPDIQGKSDMEAACGKIETRTALRADILLSK